jgi:hypothetical protein
VFGAGVIDNESRFKVVERIQNEIDILYIVFHGGGIDIVHDGFNVDHRIDAFQFGSGGDGLGEVVPHILFVVKGLPLEVREFDEIPVDDSQETDSRPYQQFGGDAAERTGADEGDASVSNFLLPFCSDGRKSNLPGIPVVIFQTASSLV